MWRRRPKSAGTRYTGANVLPKSSSTSHIAAIRSVFSIAPSNCDSPTAISLGDFRYKSVGYFSRFSSLMSLPMLMQHRQSWAKWSSALRKWTSFVPTTPTPSFPASPTISGFTMSCSAMPCFCTSR